MKSIVLIGTGNVATHLFKALSNFQDFRIIQVYNYNPESLAPFPNVPVTSNPEEIFKADIYLIAVKDDAISSVSQTIKAGEGLVLHTSGSVTLEALEKHRRTGVFYPLQTFSKGKDVDFKNIPVCIEAGNINDLEILENLAREVSHKVYHITSLQRKSLHLAAVFVSNFVNHLYTEGEQICKQNDIPFEILLPLIEETAHKVTQMSPADAQTGPAKRNDKEVINAHLEQLNEQQQKIYSLLTTSIQKLHGKEL